MSAESKRAWREANPERYAEYERIRAQARRGGYWEPPALGRAPRYCRSSDPTTGTRTARADSYPG